MTGPGAAAGGTVTVSEVAVPPLCTAAWAAPKRTVGLGPKPAPETVTTPPPATPPTDGVTASTRSAPGPATTSKGTTQGWSTVPPMVGVGPKTTRNTSLLGAVRELAGRNWTVLPLRETVPGTGAPPERSSTEVADATETGRRFARVTVGTVPSGTESPGTGDAATTVG